MKERIIEDEKIILRHSTIELAEHWILAISGLLLIFSGFGELPMYKRYMVTQIPGMGWAGDFFINLKIHYLAGIVFVSVMVFHAIFHGWLGHQGLIPKKGDIKASLITILSMFGFGKEPKSHKYLPEQRLAYAYLGGIGLVLVLTGAVKVIKNLPGVFLSPTLITSMTLIHTFATIFFLLGVLAHLAALIFKVNRPLVKSIFTGEVSLNYIQDRHTHWYDELLENQVKVKPKVEIETKAEDKEEVQAEVEVKENVEKAHGVGKEEGQVAMILKVKGMSCQHCVMSVTKALSQLDGVKNVQVDLAKGEVRFDNIKAVASTQIEKAIVDAGYEVVPFQT
ncbi:MAG: copper ion binding protein [Deltaproteobacteria bacterium]|nr:copper ion binding protein [Deltaproteobacteria bacterium]MBM4325206.1 copper ion binding protein [Deltaproteobacteria bacterium]MBM4347849.1 copper ion binding protein [Deltaproteobacteria bacterium]